MKLTLEIKQMANGDMFTRLVMPEPGVMCTPREGEWLQQIVAAISAIPHPHGSVVCSGNMRLTPLGKG